MTNEEAINVLNDYDINFERNTAEEVAEAHEMAIKAIRTIPSEDEKVIRIKKGTLKARTGRYVIYDVEWLKTHFNTTEAKIYGQPKAEGARGDIPLQQSVPKMPQPNERTETHECDYISRKAVLDALHRYFADGFDSDKWWNSTYVLDAVNRVPSATPQPKTGHWEWVQYDANPNIGNWHCSECSCILRGETNGGPVRLPKYCPECGVKMEA